MTNFKLRSQYAAKYRTTPLVDTQKVDQQFNGFEYRLDILTQAYNCWESLFYWREQCRRNDMFVYGNQWGDYTQYFNDELGRWVNIREDKLLLMQGGIPLTNNVLLSIMNTVTGLFIGNQTEPIVIARARDKQEAGEVASATLQMVYSKNKLWDLDREKLKQYLNYGFAGGQGKFAFKDSRKDVLFDDIRYDRFFYDNTMEDPRGNDCKIVGTIVDLSLEDIVKLFSKHDHKRADSIRQIYGNVQNADRNILYDNSTRQNSDSDLKDFYTPTGAFQNMQRVICVWRKECKERIFVHDYRSADAYKAELTSIQRIETENLRRKSEIAQSVNEELSRSNITPDAPEYQDQFNSLTAEYEKLDLITYDNFFDDFWAYYFLAPSGAVIDSGETPYIENTCPIVFKLDLGSDMKIHPYTSGHIDQQKIINRNLSVQDYVNRVSIKGAVFYDEDALGDDVTIADIEKKIARPGAVISYKGKKGAAPQQVTNNNSNTGAYEMVNMELQLLEKISGASNAIQGQNPSRQTTASQYAQQSQNSIGLLSVILDTFRDYRETRDRMLYKLMHQFYTNGMYVNIHSSKEVKLFDPKDLDGIDCEVSIIESQSTPSFRAIANDMLLKFTDMGSITPKMAMQLGDFPFSDQAIQLIEEQEKKQQEAAAQQPNAMVGIQQQQ